MPTKLTEAEKSILRIVSDLETHLPYKGELDERLADWKGFDPEKDMRDPENFHGIITIANMIFDLKVKQFDIDLPPKGKREWEPPIIKKLNKLRMKRRLAGDSAAENVLKKAIIEIRKMAEALNIVEAIGTKRQFDWSIEEELERVDEFINERMKEKP